MSKAHSKNANAISIYYDVMRSHLGKRGASRLQHQMEFIYKDIEFNALQVLDIGGGNGLHSFYAAASGAAHVMNIEPEDDGSSTGEIAQFEVWNKNLGNPNVQIKISTLQDFDSSEGTYDLIIIQNTINHLNEEACITLRTDEQSRLIFEQVFSKIATLAHSGTILQFSDCSSRNFFPAFGLRNPFDPGIEWHKHQPPGIWIGILERAGFKLVNKRWSTPARLGKLGKLLFGNGFFSYFFTSHFVVTMKMN